MTKLLKYEFKKTILSKTALLISLVLSEVMMLIGHFGKNDHLLGQGAILFGLVLTFGCFIIGIASIASLINDLSNNHNYMLFMTPHNGYSILGAKVLENILSTIAFVAISFLMLLGDYFIMGGPHQQKLVIDLHTQTKISAVASFFGYGVMIWLAIVALVILSIVLQATLFKDSHHSFLLSLLVFIGLIIAFSIIHGTIGGFIPTSGEEIYNVIFTLIMIVASYMTASTLMDHQLSI